MELSSSNSSRGMSALPESVQAAIKHLNEVVASDPNLSSLILSALDFPPSNRELSASPSTSSRGPPSVEPATTVAVEVQQEETATSGPPSVGTPGADTSSEAIEEPTTASISEETIPSSGNGPSSAEPAVEVQQEEATNSGPPSVEAQEARAQSAEIEEPIAEETTRKRPLRKCTTVKSAPSSSQEPKRNKVEPKTKKPTAAKEEPKAHSPAPAPLDSIDSDEPMPMLSREPTRERPKNRTQLNDEQVMPALEVVQRPEVVKAAQNVVMKKKVQVVVAKPTVTAKTPKRDAGMDWFLNADIGVATSMLASSINRPINRPISQAPPQNLGQLMGIKPQKFRTTIPPGFRRAFPEIPQAHFNAMNSRVQGYSNQPSTSSVPGPSRVNAPLWTGVRMGPTKKYIIKRAAPRPYQAGPSSSNAHRADPNLEEEDDEMGTSQEPRQDPLAKYLPVPPKKKKAFVKVEVPLMSKKVKKMKRELSNSPEPSTSTYHPTPANRSRRSTTTAVQYVINSESEEDMEDEEEEVSRLPVQAKTPSFPEILKNMKNPKNMAPENYVPYCNAYATRVFISAKYKEHVKKGRQFEAEVVKAIEAKTNGLEEENCFSVEIGTDKLPEADDLDLRNLNGFINSAVTPGTKPRGYNLYDVPKGVMVDMPMKMINCTGTIHLDRNSVKGSHITNNVVNYGRSSVSQPLDRESRKLLVPVNYAKNDLISKETRKMWTPEEKKAHPGYLPVAVFCPKTMEEFNALQTEIERASICMVRGVDKLVGMDKSKFDVEVISKANKEFIMKGPRIMGQPTSSNYQRNPEETELGKWNHWSCAHFQQKIQIEEFAKYYEKITKLTEQALDQIEAAPDSINTIIEKLTRDLHAANIQRDPEDKGLRDAISITFGSNIDITDDDEKFQEQLENIKKLPSYLLPVANGTLLDFCGIMMPGINTAQVYIKAPLVRTTAHLENGCLGSINLNLGPGTSIWYSVPVEYAGRFQELVRKKLVLEDREDQEFFAFGYWPIEGECLKAGIPLQKFIQEAGDMVFVGPGTYHWVQSNEFTTQVSWNVGSFNYRQLAWLAISHDNYLANNFAPIVPLETLCWNLLIREDAPKVEEYNMKKALKTILMRSLANCKSQEVFVEHKNLEIKLMVEDDEEDILPVETCDTCGNHTFNLFFKRKLGEDKNLKDIYCLFCANEKKMFDDPRYEVFMRHSIPFLEKVYDKLYVGDKKADKDSSKSQ